MAYQSKKHRKFVATSVTAAVVAAAVAPAAGFAAEKDFTDKIPTWAEKAVDYLVGKGAIEGHPDGSFAPNDSLTRAQAAKVLALALDLKIDDSAKADFADAANHWASKYIAAIQKEKPGVIEGYNGKFNPENKITRQEMAKMVVTAYGLKKDDAAVIKLTDNNGWGKAEVEVLASLGVVEGETTTTFNPNGNVTRAQAAVFVHRAEVPAERVAVDTTEAKVVSVSAINAKEVKVTFNQTLLEDSAEVPGSYQVVVNNGDAVAPADAVLQSDKKTVILELEDELVNGDNIKVNVLKDSLMTTKYEDVLEYKGTNIVFNDTTAPKLVEASYNGAAVEFVFDEPLDIANSNLKINGATVELADESAPGEYVYTATTTLNAGKHSYVITGAADLLGNTAGTISGEVTVSDDTTAPSVASIEKVDSDTFKITFSEVIETYGTVEVFKGAQKLNVTVEDGDNGKEKLVTVASSDPDNNPLYGTNVSSVKLDVSVKGYKDSVLLLGKDYSGSVTLTKDTTGPSMVAKNLNVVDAENQQYTVVFDEVLGDFDASKITVKKDGIIQRSVISDETAINTDNEKKLDIVFAEGTLEAGKTYVLDFAAGAIEDASENVNKAFSVTFTVSGANGTYVVPSSVTEPEDNTNTILVDFGVEMTDSATKVANYKLDGANLPSGTTIDYIDDKSMVLIKLPSSFVVPVTADYELTISDSVVTKNGEKVAADFEDGGIYKVLVGLVDNKKPVLESAKYQFVDGSTVIADAVELTFSENIAEITEEVLEALEDDFTLTQSGQKVTYTVAETASGKKLLLTFGSEINISQGLTVTVASADKLDIKDASDNKLTAGTSVTATK